MTDLLRKVQQRQWATLKRLSGELVTYAIGDESIEDLTMVRGQTRFANSLSDGEAAIELRTIDWLVDPKDLLIDNVQVEPKIGATITDADGEVYELLDLGNGMAWSPADGRKERIRIHTQHVPA